MEIIFRLKKQDLQKVKNVLLSDDVVSRASIVFKESKSLGFEKDEYYCYVSGLEEACKKAKELMKNLGKIVDKKDEEKIIDKIKEEEGSAMTGFGNIFG